MILLDACTVGYMIKSKSHCDDGKRGRKVLQILREADEAGAVVMVPALAKCEATAMASAADAAKAELLINQFRIVPFDAKAATEAAKLFRTKSWKEHIGETTTRQQVKTDVMIAGTAISHSAHRLITNDSLFTDLLSDHPIQVVILDDLVRQGNMLDLPGDVA